MLVSENDPFESFLNSIKVVKNAISPIESNFRNVAKNFEHCINGFVQNANLHGVGDANVNQVGASWHVKKIKGDNRKNQRGPTNAFFGKFTKTCGSKDHRNFSCSLDGVEELDVNLSKQRLVGCDNDIAANGDGDLYTNCLHFELESLSNEDSSCCEDSDLRVEVKQRVTNEARPKELTVKSEKELPFEYIVGFVFNQLSHFAKLDVGVQDHECRNSDCEAFTPPVNTFHHHFQALCSILGGKKADVHGLLGNLRFARIRGVPSSIVGVPSMKEVEEEGTSKTVNIPELAKLLPSDRLQEEPRISAGADDVVAVPPSADIPADSVLKSALAGGLSCALSAALMHPVDTYKTWVQASTVVSPELISRLSQLGVRGLYRGSIPAILGQFASHGLRTGICEASKFVLVNVAPTIPQIQVESVASLSSTFLGTVMRIPCEVLKQRLQAGLFENVGEALVGTWHQDGFNGFFRGTGATLCREIPFYVAGMGLYAQSKKVVQKLLGRELEPLEAIIVGAISGGLTAVSTTPLDVIKTRMMIASQGQPTSFSVIALSILRHEGPLGLFKGAVPRFFWVAPLGAMNFAGYELIRKAMG